MLVDNLNAYCCYALLSASNGRGKCVDIGIFFRKCQLVFVVKSTVVLINIVPNITYYLHINKKN